MKLSLPPPERSTPREMSLSRNSRIDMEEDIFEEMGKISPVIIGEDEMSKESLIWINQNRVEWKWRARCGVILLKVSIRDTNKFTTLFI
jgi:hypothetical protein